ncbi:MAG: efflux RND transporter periplasmic adaptor subunit [Bryobacteraceae bacterium]|nr:efflux RND transporter periplasmic adaptor subunit [Bryobacteraceae bacterium]
MKWALWICGIALLGCARQAPVEAGSEPSKEASSASEVRVEEKVQREIGLQTQTVERRRVTEAIRAEGRITMNEERTWRVGAVTEARVRRVHVNAGDRVQAGKVLAGMHSHDIHESRAQYRKAAAELEHRRSALETAQRARDRARRLYELKAGSLADVEHTEAMVRAAQSDLSAANADVNRSRLHLVEFLQVPLEEHPEHNPGDSDHEEDLIPVKSPAAGTIVSREVSVGSVVTAGAPMFTVSDLSTVWMLAQVNEQHLSKLRVGTAVRVSVQAYPEQKFTGRITRLGDEFDAATRTVRARIELANREAKLKPEMYATALIEAGGAGAALLLTPDASIQDLNGQPVVFVQKSGTVFEVQPVKTGRRHEGWTEIEQGLAEGARVVTKGAFQLKSQLLIRTLAEE